MGGVILFVSGVTLVTVTWTGVAHGVVPTRACGPLRGATVRVVVAVADIAQRLPERSRRLVVSSAVAVVLLTVGVAAVVVSVTGFALMTPLLADEPATAAAMLDALVLRTSGVGLLPGLAAVVSTFLLCAALTLYAVRFGSAMHRREQMASLLVGPSGATGGDAILERFVRRGSRPMFEDFCRQALLWLLDVHQSHLAQPLLLFVRGDTESCWHDDALVVLDAAAVAEAINPDWAPPHASYLLEQGPILLEQLARCTGAPMPPVPAEPTDADAVAGQVDDLLSQLLDVGMTAGVPRMLDPATARRTLAHRRAEYVPLLGVLCQRLHTGTDSHRPTISGLSCYSPQDRVRHLALRTTAGDQPSRPDRRSAPIERGNVP